VSLDGLLLAAAATVLVGAGATLTIRSRRREQRDLARAEEARELGMHLPASLHPIFDPDVCIGSLACVSACPEVDVLGVAKQVGTLVVGANCIGHGRCAAECPVGAIRLVFGTKERGQDIPRLTPEFESTVPGIFVVGELGGMGLVRNAVRQGKAAIAAIDRQLAAHDRGRGRPGDDLDDVVILGAGPAGFASGLACLERNLRHRIIEQDTFGGTVAHYPRHKIVMSDAIDLPLAGKINRGNISKEELIARWNDIRHRYGLEIQEGERAEDIQRVDHGFRVVTNVGVYGARRVVLAIGRRGSPRRLGVLGEDLPTVTYRLIEPEQYRRRSVLVVGGGDSAVEAACALTEIGATVSLCHRGASFDRCKPANRSRVAQLESAQRLRLHLRMAPVRFEPRTALLAPFEGESPAADRANRVPADYVIVCAGGDLPTALLNRVGLQVDRHYGEWE
jgi:thioredoxin reductase/Pyruvate/2-oxoacid:ferredoxin oxidoreductase delta subunit